jgi:peroxin-5
MAELAARVIDAVRDEQNPKFQQSQFMSLMRQFRDGEVVVEDDKIVPSESSTATRVDVKGKGRAVDIPVREVHQPGMVHSVPASSVQGYQGSVELNEAYRHQHKDANEAYFQRENEEFSEYWDAHYTGPVPNTVSAGEQGSWHELQEAWDGLEATSTGIKPIVNYQFQANNPYLLGDSSKMHQMHMSQAQRLYDVSCMTILDPINLG